MPPPTRVALVDDHRLLAQTLAVALQDTGFDAVLVDPADDVVARVAQWRAAVVLLDLGLRDGVGGDELVPLLVPAHRVVVLTAVGKVGATPRMGPSAPGAADGVGSLVALDCKAGNEILIAGYSPKKALDVPAAWRGTTPKKVEGDDATLLSKVCEGADKLPVK